MTQTSGVPRTLGRYEIQKELGRGAMGVVYQARDPQIGRQLVLKVVRLQGAVPGEEEQLRERFRREAAAAGRLSHPGIVTVHDVGRDEATGAEFIAMELVSGAPLASLVSAGIPLTVEQVLSDMEQVADALDYAHAAGVVHRDVKPSNILVGSDGRLKVADFGVARLASSDLTRAGQVLGSPAYMSPEQITGQTPDGRSDQFSLAVVVYQLLTGKLPFDGDKVSTIYHKVVNAEPPPPHQLRKELPAGLSDALLRALAKDPAARYRSCREMMAALRAAAQAPAATTSPRVALAPPPRADEIAYQPLPAIPAPAASSPVTASRRRGGGGAILAAIAVGMVVLGIGIAALFLMSLPDAGTGAPPLRTESPRASATPFPDRATERPAEEVSRPDRAAPVSDGAETDGEAAPAAPPTEVALTRAPAAVEEPVITKPPASEAAPAPSAPADPRPAPVEAPEERPAPVAEASEPAPLAAPPPPDETTAGEPSPATEEPAAAEKVAYVFVPNPGEPLPEGHPPTDAALVVALADHLDKGQIDVLVGGHPVFTTRFDEEEKLLGTVELPGMPPGGMRTTRRFPIGISAGEHDVTIRVVGEKGGALGAGLVEIGKGQVCTLDVDVRDGQLLMRMRCS